MSRLALLLLLALATPSGAVGQSAEEVRALQFALAHVPRYRPGPVDGISGPRTRGAIDSYSGSRPLDGAFWSVAAHVEQLVWWRRPWTPEVGAAVDAALRAALRSGAMPAIRERRFFAVDGGAAACVRVNSAYGPRWLHLTLVPVQARTADGRIVARWRAGPPAGVTPEAASLWCRLGYAPAGSARPGTAGAGSGSLPPWAIK